MRVLIVLLLTLVTGCGHVVEGGARPATTAVGILPSEAELTEAVGNGLSTFDFAPFVGGLEIMPDGFRADADASPFECIGVTETMLRATYVGADVIEAARQSYFTLVPQARVTGADAAAVRFGSAAAAQDRFRTFTDQWRDCDGRTVVKRLPHATSVEADIADVTAEGTLLTASVATRQGATASSYLRAVGIRDATIVEVSLAVANRGRTDSDSPAERAVEAMLAKVGDG